MNDSQTSNPGACTSGTTCATCPAASCGCGCQNDPGQAATQAAGGSDATCQCGPSCACARS